MSLWPRTEWWREINASTDLLLNKEKRQSAAHTQCEIYATFNGLLTHSHSLARLELFHWTHSSASSPFRSYPIQHRTLRQCCCMRCLSFIFIFSAPSFLAAFLFLCDLMQLIRYSKRPRILVFICYVDCY